jgi:hypothetical protein
MGVPKKPTLVQTKKTIYVLSIRNLDYENNSISPLPHNLDYENNNYLHPSLTILTMKTNNYLSLSPLLTTLTMKTHDAPNFVFVRGS